MQGGSMIRVEAPLESVPMFVRAGAVIPMGPEMNYVGEKPSDPLSFMIYPNENGESATALYEDDGVSPTYKHGVYRRTRIAALRVNGVIKIELSEPEGSYNPGPRDFVFFVKSVSAAWRGRFDGKVLAVTAAGGKRDGGYTHDCTVAVRIVADC